MSDLEQRVIEWKRVRLQRVLGLRKRLLEANMGPVQQAMPLMELAVVLDGLLELLEEESQ